MEATTPRYYGPFIAMTNAATGKPEFVPAKLDEHGRWVPLTADEVKAQSR